MDSFNNGDMVWVISNPSVMGRFSHESENGELNIFVEGSMTIFSKDMITNNPQKVIKMLMKKVGLLKNQVNRRNSLLVSN
jgi:hypothetical protein